MKHPSVAIIAVCSVLSLISAGPAEAGGGHGIRIDDENGAGCMSTYNTDSTENSPSGVFTSAAGAFIPGGSYLNATVCSPISASNPIATSVLFPDGTFNGAANNDAISTSIATNGTMYQYFADAITTPATPDTPATNNIPTAQVSVWTLANQDTEIEMNGWCPNGSGASFKFGGNTFAGGCGDTSPDDLLFDKTGSVIGFVSYTDGDPRSPTTGVVKDLVGWTENGKALGGSTIAAPEIDPTSAMAAITLLLGGLAVLRGSRRTLVPAGR
jgi:hypothetical protein